VTAKTDLPQVPAALADAALIDGPTCAATGAVSLSWWHEEVRAGRAPQPAIRRPRCTRWRLADVARFWREFTERTADDGSVTQRAAKASAKAKIKRQAAQAGA
jgi:hypothetical protein